MPSASEHDLLEHWTALVRVTQGLVDSREDAEDCASAAVLQLLERGEAGIENPEAFLVTVAKRRAVDKTRSHGRARKRDVRLAGQPPTPLDVAEDVAARAEARWVAQVARERLSPKAYQLLQLLADGHHMADAADALGITRRGAESLLLRARRTVRFAWSKTLALLGGVVLLGRRLRVAAPAAALAASVLVLAGSPHIGSAGPTTNSPAAAAPEKGATNVSLHLNATLQRARPTTSVAAHASTQRTHPTTRATTVVDVRPPTGGRAHLRSEERPGASSSRVDTVRRCVQDFQVTTDHIGC